jgi:hypothetical protein
MARRQRQQKNTKTVKVGPYTVVKVSRGGKGKSTYIVKRDDSGPLSRGSMSDCLNYAYTNQ